MEESNSAYIKRITSLSSTTRLIRNVIFQSKPLLALALWPILVATTTIIFMSIYYTRGPCQEARDIPSLDAISIALCCTPEYYIGAIGCSAAGVLGLYGIIGCNWCSRCASGMSSNCCEEEDTRILHKVLFGIPFFGLIGVSTISLNINFIIHTIPGFCYFLGGIAIICKRTCHSFRCRKEIKVETSLCDCDMSSNLSMSVNILRRVSKILDLLSVSQFFVSELYFIIVVSIKISHVPWQALLSTAMMTTQYSFICDILIHEIVHQINEVTAV